MGVIHFAGTSLPPQYGTGSDGAITITSGTIAIEDIYELEDLVGITTKFGVDKGLNHGAGTYDPENDAYINSSTFTIAAGATLDHDTAWGNGSSNKNGIIWIACTGIFTNEGTINLDSKGANGGAADANGGGTGHGHKGVLVTGGAGGTSYGTPPIPDTTWGYLYGSGGGGGGTGYDDDAFGSGVSGGGGGGAGHVATGVTGTNGASAGTAGAPRLAGGVGGKGGGAVRIFAATLITDSGTITVDGAVGAAGVGGNYNDIGCGGGGGGGSAGTIYIETLGGATLGTNQMTASAGTGGAGGHNTGGAPGPDGGPGGAGKQGRIHVVGSYAGSTNDPAIA